MLCLQVESIVENEGHVGSRAALNIVEQLEKKMARQDAECLLERLQAERWVLQVSINRAVELSLTVTSSLSLLQKGDSRVGNDLSLAASEILGKHWRKKIPWVTAEILDLCDKRRELRKKKI